MSSFQPASSLPRDMNAGTNAGSTSTSSGASVIQPRPRPLIRGAAGTGSTIVVNNCQRGNPVLAHIRNIGWEYGDIVPDYQVGLSSCILFLSIRYHRLHPEYVHGRIQKLGQMYTLRVLLVLCDVQDHQSAIKELTKTCMINNLTLMLAWTAEEAGRYIETYKSFEHKPPDLIQERVAEDYLSQVTNVLTQVRGVNRTDVVTLLTRFGSVKGVVKALESGQGVGMCPGFGEVKAKRLSEVVRTPFRSGEARRYKERKLGNIPRGNGSGAAETVTAPDAQPDLVPPPLVDAQPLSTSTTCCNSSRVEPDAPDRALTTLELHLDDVHDVDEQEQLQMALRMSMQP